MPALQLLLFPDPRPLVERLGSEFFKELPEHPGVYLMRDAADAVLYVGKAKNLRQRLSSYRVANPDRVPPRHLRLLRAVTRIELESCADESAALRRESELLRSLRPRFNRAGTWPAVPRCLVWRRHGEHLVFTVTESQMLEPGWEPLGRAGGAARYLKPLVLRLVWRAVHRGSGADMPAGWHRGLTANITWIQCAAAVEDVSAALAKLHAGDLMEFCRWLQARQLETIHPFDRIALSEDLEALRKMIGTRLGSREN